MYLIDPEKCPICSSKFTKFEEEGNPRVFDLICTKNRCFEYEFYSGEVDVKFFDEYMYGKKHMLPYEVTEQIQNKINYWKENDRYLIKILSGDS